MTSSTAGGAAAAAIAVAEAVKASGAIIRVRAPDFSAIVDREDKPLVVIAEKKFFSRSYHYLTSYKGLIFYTRHSEPLLFKGSVEIIRARQIWIPS